jgi:hypothetical protein
LFKKIFFILLSVFFINTSLFAAGITELIDTPTHSILDYGSYEIQFRIFANGGVTPRLNFGIFKVLNIGVSWEFSNIIGVGNAIVAVPALQLKLNVYEGDANLPGVAVGYDGQGFFYNDSDGEFLQKGKGVYVVAGKELFLPGLNFNIGLNVNDFKEVRLLGFAGSSYSIVDETLLAMLEYDNIGQGAYSRLNAGFKLWATENFGIDLILRNILTGDQEKFGCERVLRLSYQSRF